MVILLRTCVTTGGSQVQLDYNKMIKDYFRLNVWACFLLAAILNLQSAGVSSGTKQSWAPGIVGYSQKSLEASRYGKQVYLPRILRPPRPCTSCLQNSKWLLKEKPTNHKVSINLYSYIKI